MCKTVQKSRANNQGDDGFQLSLVPEFTAPPVVRHRSTPSPCATGRAAAAALLQLISAAANFRTRFRKEAGADWGKFSESSFAPRLPLLPYSPTCGTRESEATRDAAKSILQTTQLALARFSSSSLSTSSFIDGLPHHRTLFRNRCSRRHEHRHSLAIL